MQQIKRMVLEDDVTSYLHQKTTEIGSRQDQKEAAASLWGGKAAGQFSRVRTALKQMAGGRQRCMYCGDSAGTDIDHFRPKKTFPLLTFVWENYLLACSYCNSNAKREAFPVDASGNPMLVDPTAEDPSVHLSLSPSLGEVTARTSRGMSTIETMGLNRAHLVQGRIDAWVACEALVREYSRTSQQGNHSRAQRIATALGSGIFPEVMEEIVRAADSGFGIAEDVALIIREYPQLRECTA